MLAKKISGRKSPRSPVTPLDIKGHLLKANGNLTQVVVVWNVSDTGLCLWVTEKFKSGDLIAFQLTHPAEVSIACKVRWVRTIPERSGYLLGLESVGDRASMRAVYALVLPQTSKR
ncbi:MAG: PilZ domain-containing protein [Proteobacteria bacterium]|nr:PilZ domain-containing protein [Pseudomonadota bacterium]